MVVLDAEDLAAAEAVARERGVPVDARAVEGTAVPELAHVAAAAAVPRALTLRVEAEAMAGGLAHAAAGCARQRPAVRVHEPRAAVVDRVAVTVDAAA